MALRACVQLRQEASLQRIRRALDTLRGDLGERDHLSQYRLVADSDRIYLAEPDGATDLVIARAQTVIHELVDVLQPFYRDGRHIPALLTPRDHVSVDPAVRGGEPVIEGTRVPSADVAALVRDGVPPEQISDYYPAVSAEAARDAADFADYVDSYGDRPARGSRLLKLLLDENVPRPMAEIIRILLKQHVIDHVHDLPGWAGTKDIALYCRARTAGFDVMVTNDTKQMKRPMEVAAIARSEMHRIEYRQNNKHGGLVGLGTAIATVCAGLPHAIAALEESNGQRLISLNGIDPTRGVRIQILDPASLRPLHWPDIGVDLTVS